MTDTASALTVAVMMTDGASTSIGTRIQGLASIGLGNGDEFRAAVEFLARVEDGTSIGLGVIGVDRDNGAVREDVALIFAMTGCKTGDTNGTHSPQALVLKKKV
jgi:hypothetical protein